MTQASGRWDGRLTKRPLPLDDSEVDALDDTQRAELTEVWLARAASERRVADAFAVIAADLSEISRSPQLLTLARRAIDDEHRHAELARVVASRFAGKPLDPPETPQLVVPEHAGVNARLAATLRVLGHCAMNETFASAYLEAALRSTQAPLARSAVRALLSDEIDHARIGWGHLAELSAAERRELVPHLPALVSANLRMWRIAPRPYFSDPAVERHGALRESLLERALLEALRDLILPGLEAFALPTGTLRDWLARGAPTAASEPRVA